MVCWAIDELALNICFIEPSIVKALKLHAHVPALFSSCVHEKCSWGMTLALAVQEPLWRTVLVIVKGRRTYKYKWAESLKNRTFFVKNFLIKAESEAGAKETLVVVAQLTGREGDTQWRDFSRSSASLLRWMPHKAEWRNAKKNKKQCQALICWNEIQKGPYTYEAAWYSRNISG